MFKRVFKLFQIARRLSTSGAVDIINQVHQIPVPINLFFSFISIGTENNRFENNQKPGEKYEYSNLAVGILGYLLAKIESTTYEELLKKYIYEKYDLKYTTTDRTRINSKLVKGRKPNGEINNNWDLEAIAPASHHS